MTGPQIDPLLEWNRLARQNAEDAIVGSMFEAILATREHIDTFSTWLLAATAAIASFLVSNADKLTPILGKAGFQYSGMALCASCALGLLTKVFSVRAKVMQDGARAARETFNAHYTAYKTQVVQIQEHAEVRGITVETGIRIDRVLEEFSKPFPWWARAIARRKWEKMERSPNVGFVAPVRNLFALGLSAFLQALSFIAFLGIGFLYAAAT